MPKITYSDEFKRDAVALVASGIPQKQVVKDLGVAKTTLQAWVRDARFQSHGMTPTTDPEARKDQLWLTDITEHRTREGKVYLCAIKDVNSQPDRGLLDRLADEGPDRGQRS